MKPFPEIAEMTDVAERFLSGQAHFSALAGAAMRLEFAAKAFSAHPAILEMAQEWVWMTDRCWNEYHQHGNPISEAELREWVREQLAALGIHLSDSEPPDAGR